MLVNASSFFMILLPALVQQQLHMGAVAYGAVLAAQAVGSGVAGILLASRLSQHLRRPGYVTAIALTLSGASVVTMGQTHYLWVMLVASGIVGCTSGLIGVTLMTLIQLTVPGEHMGKARALMIPLNTVLLPLTSLLAGWAAQRFHAAPIFTAGGLWLWIPALLVLGLPTLRRSRITSSPESSA